MQADEQGKTKILFLCGYNSVRSQIAEGLMRSLFGTRFEVFSAGVASGGVSPYSVAVMREIGVDISGQRSKSLTEFRGWHFDVVVTLCGHGRDACARYLPDAGRIIHHPFSPPDEVGSDTDRIMNEFRVLRDEMKSWLEQQFG